MTARVEIAQQTSVFLGACLLGALLGVAFDLVRTIRLMLPRKGPLIMAEDILYWCLAALTTALYLINTNDGQIRAFILVGEGLGAVVYGCTLSKAVRRVCEGLVWLVHRLVVRPLGKILEFAAKVVGKLANLVLQILIKPYLFFRNCLKRAAHLLYNYQKARFLTKRKGSGTGEEEHP